MLNLFNKKQKNTSILLDNKVITCITEDNNLKYQSKDNPIKYYPSASKEWFNSIYAYNKSYIKSLVNIDKIVNNLFKSYINIIENKIKILFKRRRVRKNRFSANRIYISRAEMKHTNTKVVIILYTYNKQKHLLKRKIKNIFLMKYIDNKNKQFIRFIIDNIRLSVKWTKFEIWKTLNNISSEYKNYKSNKGIYNKEQLSSYKSKLDENKQLLYSHKCELNYFTNKNRKKNILWYISKKSFSFFKLWKFFICKKKNNILFLWVLSNVSNTYLILRKMRNLILLKKLLLLEEKFFYYVKLLNFNKCKFTNLFLNSRGLGLISLISKIYNKKVELKIVELKSIHLSSDLFSSAIALKLRNRKNKVVRVLRKALVKMVQLPSLHSLLTSDNDINTINKNNILNFLKQKVISGIRFEASGRLTRRLTASRSIFKYRYKGSLKNIHSSYNNLSSVMLRGHVKSNLQYTIINSKTRNGAFGLKGWVSSH